MSRNMNKTRHLSEKEKLTIKKSFELLDIDKDGLLNYYETKAAIRALGFDIKKSQVRAMMMACDKYGGEKMNYENYYYIMADKMMKRDPMKELKYVFKLFSGSDGDKITLSDLKDINSRLNIQLSDEELRGMIEEFDFNADGCIDETEFISIMSNSSEL